MSNVFEVDKYTYSKDENYLFDANIWLKLFSPYTFEDQKLNDIYTRMLRNILSINGSIYTNNMIVSEVVNQISQTEYKFCRNYYEKDDPVLKDFTHKRFRETEHYKEEVSFFISCQIRKIADISKLCDVNADATELLYNIADIFEECKLDYNDIIHLKTCEEKNFTLITHDSDFKDCGIKVITANKAMHETN